MSVIASDAEGFLFFFKVLPPESSLGDLPTGQAGLGAELSDFFYITVKSVFIESLFTHYIHFAICIYYGGTAARQS